MEKSVFITGATVNTGLGIAEKFAKEGYNLFLGSRNAENAEKTAKELSVYFTLPFSTLAYSAMVGSPPYYTLLYVGGMVQVR